MSFVYIILSAYLIGVNIAGLVMLFIQKKEKNLSPCERSFSDTNDRTDTEQAAMAHSLSKIPDSCECTARTVDNEQIVDIPNAVTGTTKTPQSETFENVQFDVKLKIPIEEPVKTRRQKRLEKRNDRKNAKLNSKNPKKDKTKKPISDFTIFLLAILGGALFIYAGMFFMKYKLKNIPFMLAIPTIIGLNIFLFIKLYGALMLWGIVAAAPK